MTLAAGTILSRYEIRSKIGEGGMGEVLQPIDGSAARQITDFKTNLIFSFDWSRDGKQLVLARGVIDTDVLLMNLK